MRHAPCATPVGSLPSLPPSRAHARVVFCPACSTFEHLPTYLPTYLATALSAIRYDDERSAAPRERGENVTRGENQCWSVRACGTAPQLPVHHRHVITHGQVEAAQALPLPPWTERNALLPPCLLRELRAAHNRIRTLPDLSLCSALEVVDMSSNETAETEEVHRLMPVQSLQHLDLSQNRIHKLCHLTTLAALKKLRHLAIQGNPCWVSHYFFSSPVHLDVAV